MREKQIETENMVKRLRGKYGKDSIQEQRLLGTHNDFIDYPKDREEDKRDEPYEFCGW